MESLRAERDCSSLVRWREGGGSEWTGGGERKCGSLDIPRLGKTLQWEAEVTGTESFQKGRREREKLMNYALIIERRQLWRIRRGHGR